MCICVCTKHICVMCVCVLGVCTNKIRFSSKKKDNSTLQEKEREEILTKVLVFNRKLLPCSPFPFIYTE